MLESSRMDVGARQHCKHCFHWPGTYHNHFAWVLCEGDKPSGQASSGLKKNHVNFLSQSLPSKLGPVHPTSTNSAFQFFRLIAPNFGIARPRRFAAVCQRFGNGFLAKSCIQKLLSITTQSQRSPSWAICRAVCPSARTLLAGRPPAAEPLSSIKRVSIKFIFLSISNKRRNMSEICRNRFAKRWLVWHVWASMRHRACQLKHTALTMTLQTLKHHSISFTHLKSRLFWVSFLAEVPASHRKPSGVSSNITSKANKLQMDPNGLARLAHIQLLIPLILCSMPILQPRHVTRSCGSGGCYPDLVDPTLGHSLISGEKLLLPFTSLQHLFLQHLGTLLRSRRILRTYSNSVELKALRASLDTVLFLAPTISFQFPQQTFRCVFFGIYIMDPSGTLRK